MGCQAELETSQAAASKAPALANMAPMKAMKKAGAKAITKSAIASTPATENELKPKQINGIMGSLAALATSEVKKAGKFVIPGLCMIKTRQKPATKAGTRMAFGKEIKVKAKPAKTVIKAFPVAALKAQIK